MWSVKCKVLWQAVGGAIEKYCNRTRLSGYRAPCKVVLLCARPDLTAADSGFVHAQIFGFKIRSALDFKNPAACRKEGGDDPRVQGFGRAILGE